ncbi:hypothetical protein ACQEVY_23350 [Streptomyces sp. CA-288835]|uniref:hypothetical protein n=1 Tax=Streptomyces sp. CA-288835 TaxID=3240069 RepID=UPI003D945A45
MTTDRLEAAARRALASLTDLIHDSADPGTEALGAQFELEQALLGAAPAVVQPAPVGRAAVLTEAERTMLGYALGLAQEQMYSRGDEFSADDQAAVDKLRRMAATDPSWPRRAWDLGLLHKGGDPHHCPACVAQPEPPKDFICPGAEANAEVLANPQPAQPAQPGKEPS